MQRGRLARLQFGYVQMEIDARATGAAGVIGPIVDRALRFAHWSMRPVRSGGTTIGGRVAGPVNLTSTGKPEP
jgi:hypothetical protein